MRHTHDLGWFIVPSILVAGALVPAWLRCREFPRLGLDQRHFLPALEVLCHICIYVFAALLVGLWFLTQAGLSIPLEPVIPEQHDWLTWVVYQFMYVAVAEEVFFRGYVQGNLMRLMGRHPWSGGRVEECLAVFVSAAVFAMAHFVVQGQAVSLLTFLPGLILAWLFLRTRTLLAPILFHGLANVTYGILALTLA
jgi:membrane protease YdiL (CAAX protease family)